MKPGVIRQELLQIIYTQILKLIIKILKNNTKFTKKS